MRNDGSEVNKLSSVTFPGTTIQQILALSGPRRSSAVADWLIQQCGTSHDAARKRISRIKPPIRKFPIPLFPKGEAFIYLQEQRKEERFWTNLLADLRETGSIFGIALDGLIARCGVVREENFAVVAGATVTPRKRQIMAETVADRLSSAGLIDFDTRDDTRYVFIRRSEVGYADWDGANPRNLAEQITLDGLREWARKLGLASYDKIRIRGDSDLKPVGGFQFDLAGPSYLLPLKRNGNQPGFLVADVFSEGILDESHIRFFLRKASALNLMLKNNGVLALLVADGFTGTALTAGHAAGVVLATPENLFGVRTGRSIRTLLETLKDAAAYASSSPDRLVRLVEELAEIEGAAGNLRGVLFELLVAYLARQDAVSIDMGIRARQENTGKTADIDVLKVTSHKASCTAIECKAKVPGGSVTLEEAQDWTRRLPIFQSHLRSRTDLREATLKFELWTSGTFSTDALAYLTEEKEKRQKFPIEWKDGEAVLAIAQCAKEKSIADALRQHFIRHPLQEVVFTVR